MFNKNKFKAKVIENGFTIKQIAEFLDCPEGTVKTNIHRGIALLRDQLKEVIVNE